MGYYPAFRFVIVLECDDEQDFSEFRLELMRSQEFTQTWEDDGYPQFGIKFKTYTMEVSFYDPDEASEDVVPPRRADWKNPFVYMEHGIDDALSIVQLQNQIKRHKEILKALKKYMPHRKPSLSFEPFWM